MNLNNNEEVEITQEDAVFLLSEPITWSWIAIEIGKGVLAEIGAQIFNSIFSRGINIESIIRNLLTEIDKIVTIRLEESFISEAVAKAKTTDFYLRQYLNSPTKERLNLIYENSAYLINRFEQFNHKTYNEYILAVSFQLVALEEMYLTNPSEKQNIIDLLTKAKQNILRLNDGWKSISDKRFKIEAVNPPGAIVVSWVAEGQTRISPVYRGMSKTEEVFEIIKSDRFKTDIMEPIMIPSSEIISLWDQRIIQLNSIS